MRADTNRDEQSAMMPERPRARRPRFPEGYGAPKDADTLLPWSHVVERMSAAHTFWVCTVDGTTGVPHTVPVWGVWVRDTFYFHVAPTSQTGRNLARNPAVVVHLPSGDDVVIIKGTVERVRNDILGPVLAAEVATASRKQYPEAFLGAETWHYQPHEGESFAVRPSIVYAWTNLAIDPTRWDWATDS